MRVAASHSRLKRVAKTVGMLILVAVIAAGTPDLGQGAQERANCSGLAAEQRYAPVCSAALGVREVELDPEARDVVCQFNTGAMKVGDGGDEAQTETATRTSPASLEAIKAPQNMLALLDRNPRSTIGYRKDRPVSPACDRDNNQAFRTAVLYGVVDQVRDGFEQQIPIADHIYVIVPGKLQRDVVVLGRRIMQLDDLACNLSQIETAELSGPAVGLDLRDPQKRRKSLQNFVQLSDHIAE